jgi:hypothetical protein
MLLGLFRLGKQFKAQKFDNPLLFMSIFQNSEKDSKKNDLVPKLNVNSQNNARTQEINKLRKHIPPLKCRICIDMLQFSYTHHFNCVRFF